MEKPWNTIKIVYRPQSAVKLATIVAHTGTEVIIFNQGTGGAFRERERE